MRNKKLMMNIWAIYIKNPNDQGQTNKDNPKAQHTYQINQTIKLKKKNCTLIIPKTREMSLHRKHGSVHK